MSVWGKLAAVGAALSLAGLPASAAARQGEVAVTFDDLPWLSIVHDQTYIDRTNIRLVRQLRRHHIPAIGFVNEGKLEELSRPRQVADLERWVAAGMDLGNHSYSHDDPDDLGTTAYLADIARGEPVTRALLAAHGKRLRWYRFPYLATGSTAAAKNAIASWLARHGYRIAPVTIESADWEFAEPYDDAVRRGDVAAQRRIRAEYLAYTAKRIAWSQASARVLFGRDIAQVMLLHCSRLNADTFGSIAALLRRARLRPVSLARAMRDPVYRKPDTYIGKDGTDWLDRWALASGKDLPARGDGDPPADIKAAYDRVDNDRTVAAAP